MIWPDELESIIRAKLPSSPIVNVQGEGSLQFTFDNVVVNIQCPFRLSNEKTIFYYNYDDEFEIIKDIIINKSVIEFGITRNIYKVTDPYFIIDGHILELFSISGGEPWTIDIVDGGEIRNLFIGNDRY